MLKILFLCMSLFFDQFALNSASTICDPNTSKCYMFNHTPLNFEAAESNCSSFGGNLTSIENIFENQFIQNKAKVEFGTFSSVWIGGTKSNGGSWTWIDGSKFQFTNWAPGFPGAPIPDVALILQAEDGQWTVSEDLNSNPFVCSVSYMPTTLQTTTSKFCPPFAACEDGWTPMNVSCYKIIHNVEFQEAEGNCTQMGAHLASIHSQEENDMIAEFSSTGGDVPGYLEQVWIGLYRSVLFVYTWTDGSQADFFTWAKGEPNSPGPACTLLMADYQTRPPHSPYYRKWNDDLCYNKMRAAVCQKPQQQLT